MKTTIDLPDELLIAAKQRAAEDRSTLRAIVERGVRAQLARTSTSPTRRRRRPIRWVTVDGGLPPGLEMQDRAAMHDWLRTRA